MHLISYRSWHVNAVYKLSQQRAVPRGLKLGSVTKTKLSYLICATRQSYGEMRWLELSKVNLNRRFTSPKYTFLERLCLFSIQLKPIITSSSTHLLLPMSPERRNSRGLQNHCTVFYLFTETSRRKAWWVRSPALVPRLMELLY